MKSILPKHLITSVLLLFFCLNLTQFANAQCPITPPDLSIGCGSSTTITADPAFTSYTPQPNFTSGSFPCGAVPIPVTPAFTTACDDCVTPAVPIGFSFSFYGNTYTNGYISSNGILGFSNTPLDYDNYDLNPIPSATGANNFIAGMYADIDIRCGGTITYAQIGTAPNRRFVVSYNNVRPYGGGFPTCSGTGTASFQIILNENNTFNTVITQLSANWNTTTSGGPNITVGAENLSGTVALALPGMNAQNYGGITPADNFCYNYTTYLCGFTNWRTGGASGTIVSSPANNNVLTVSPTTTTTYTGTWQCGPTTCTDDIVVTIIPPTLTMGAVTNNNSCITPNGAIAFTTNFGNGTYTLSYLKNGTATTSSITVAGGAFTLSGLDAGAYTNFSIPTPIGCTPLLVGTVANITNPVAVTGTGVSICTGGSGSLTSTGGATPIIQGTAFNIGNLATTDPTWIRTGTGACSISTTTAYYDVLPFTVSASGTYTFSMCTPGTNWDGFAALYQNSFNPTSQCTNYMMASDDDNNGGNCDNDALLTATLNTGVTYYLVTSSWFGSTVGNYEWSYTSAGTPTALTSGSTTTSSPRWTHAYQTTTCLATNVATQYYDVFSFTVPTTGTYTLDMCTPSTDGYASLYQNAFNGASPCATPSNHIISADGGNSNAGCTNDPSITTTLTAGVTYFLVSTSFSAFTIQTGAYSWTITSPNTNTISTAPLLQWYTVATGGTPIGTGSPFNPVGVAGSGLANTATAGTTTYYLATAANPTCRTPVTYAITNAATAPTSISNSTGGAVCNGLSTTLTAVGGASGGGSVLNWYSGSCGTGTFLGTGTSIIVSPTATTTYYVRYQGGCGNTTCATTSINVNTVSTALTTIGVPVLSCPNTIITLTASGGTAGTGSTINWYDGANGTGTLLGTGASISVFSPNATATYYVRRDGGTCAPSADLSFVVNVRTFAYATGATNTSTTYCTDKDGWNHFFNASNQIIFSVNSNSGTIGAGSTATINIKPSGAYYQSPNVAKTFGNCFSGDESFEMVRSWNFTLSGAPTGTYQVRFYYLPVERTDVENRANAWRAATASVAPTNLTCTYSNKYVGSTAPNYATNGFYWFKNAGSAYTAAAYDGLHLQNTNGLAPGSITYVELSGITSFSGGSGAVVLVPLVPLPVSLVSFSGKRMTPNQVKLSWETVQEIDNAGFEVEMSADARNFEKIGFLKGQGNNKTVASYEMPYTNSVGGYFRLKQLDNNGQFVYSKIIYINGTAEGVIRIYPNPATDNVTIDLGQLKADESATATFRSVLGVIVSEKTLSQVQTDIAFGHLAKGIYLVEINKNGKKTIAKIVLQ